MLFVNVDPYRLTLTVLRQHWHCCNVATCIVTIIISSGSPPVFLECTSFYHLDLFCSLSETDVMVDEQNICPVCKNLLTEVFLTDCGHHVCGTCRAQLLATSRADCPVCHKFGVFSSLNLHKNVQHDDNSIKVHCRKLTKQSTREYNCTHVPLYTCEFWFTISYCHY